MKTNKWVAILVAILIFTSSFACILPGVGIATKIESESTMEVVTPTLETNCGNSNGGNMVTMRVEAYPDGLNLRKFPNGDVIATIPDKFAVEVFLLDSGDNWAKIRYRDLGGNILCGFVNNKFLKDLE